MEERVSVAQFSSTVGVHGWGLERTDADPHGARFKVTGVEFVEG
jgi:hypothetical protein